MKPSAAPKYHLLDFLDVQTLRGLQDSLAAVSGLPIALVDPQGTPIVPPAAANEFCRLMCQSPSGRLACQASIAEAASIHSPRDMQGRHTCHAGLARHTAPIVVAGQHLATILIGERPTQPLADEHVRDLARRHKIDPQQLTEAAANLQGWPDRHMAAANDLAQLLANSLARLCYREHQLRLRTEELSTLYQAAGLVAGGGDLQEVLDRIAAQVRQTMTAKAVSIRLLDETTGELTIKAVSSLSQEYLNKGPVTVTENPIDADALAGNLVYVADSRTDPRVRYPAQARKEGLVSTLVAGMVYRDRPVGVMRIYMDTVYRFSDYERSLLWALASQAATAVVNARLYEEARAAERQQRQLQYAGEIQRRMIPQKPPPHDHVQLGCVYNPLMDVGGDFYDFIPLGKGHLGITIADVVGKGVPASLMMASLRSALRTYAEGIYDLDKVMSRVNRHMYRDTRSSEFATVFYGVLSPDARRLTYCNAGHSPPLLLRDGSFQTLDAGGTVMGMDPGATYDKGILHLSVGDILVLYTDGLVDAINFDDERFGADRLRKSILTHKDADAGQLAQQLLWDVRRFKGLADLIDDITIVTVKVVSQSATPTPLLPAGN